jgi:hypothetical protein
MDDVRYGSLKVVTNCSFCKTANMINGPLLKMKCKFCDKEFSFNKKLWEKIIYKLDDFIYYSEDDTEETFSYTPLGNNFGVKFIGVQPQQIKVTYCNDVPKCVKCKTELNVDGVHSDSIKCEECEEVNSVFKAPEWITYPNVVEIIGGVEEGGDSKIDLDKSLQPIAMNCPNCSSPLKITQEKTRVTTCEYCESEFYIPEPVWEKLHPKKVVTSWSIKFEGKGLCIINKQKQYEILKIEQEKNRIADLRSAEIDRIAQIKKEEYNRASLIVIGHERRIVENRGGWSDILWIGYFVCVLLGFFAIGLPVIFNSNLSHLVGNTLCDGELVEKMSPKDSNEMSEFFCRKNGKLVSMKGEVGSVGIFGGIFFLAFLWSMLLILIFKVHRKRVVKLNIELESATVRLKQIDPVKYDQERVCNGCGKKALYVECYGRSHCFNCNKDM